MLHFALIVFHFRQLFACSYFSTHLQCKVLSMLLFCLPRKVTKRVPSRTTFLRISLTCRFKRAAARVRAGMLLHLTWYAFQVERWSRSTLTTWLYRDLCRVRSGAYFAQNLAVRKSLRDKPTHSTNLNMRRLVSRRVCRSRRAWGVEWGRRVIAGYP